MKFNRPPNRIHARIECIDEQVVHSLRRHTPSESVALINDANRTARMLLAAGIRHSHCDWSAQQVDEEVASRMLSGAR
jgi:hypothetical protein